VSDTCDQTPADIRNLFIILVVDITGAGTEAIPIDELITAGAVPEDGVTNVPKVNPAVSKGFKSKLVDELLIKVHNMLALVPFLYLGVLPRAVAVVGSSARPSSG
jgi:hypothetical protein